MGHPACFVSEARQRRSRFPEGMTARKARAKAKATAKEEADSQRE
jgi:hypothetical protein